MLQIVTTFKCGIYHPYWSLGVKNPKCDRLSRLMMDFKDEKCSNNQRAVNHFSRLAIDTLSTFSITGNRGKFVEYPFRIVVVPSSKKDRISPSLEAVAEKISKAYPQGSVYNCLRRKVDVLSAHKEGGDRSISGHMSTIECVDGNLQNSNVLLLDDVKTTGGSLSACYYLLESSGAGIILPIALLNTANYEG